MYQCCVCKKWKDGEPVMKNGAGVWCQECKEMYMTGKNGTEDWDGRCLYCGKIMSAKQRERHNGVHSRIHSSCQAHRDWMLKCIKNSPKLAQYVAKKEAEYAEERDARIKREKETSNQEKASNGRIDRLENMMTKLMSELGVEQ